MTERRRRWALAVAATAVLAVWATGASAETQRASFAIGYLEIADDPRYQEHRGYTGRWLRTRKRPIDGALLALRDVRFAGRALGFDFRLERAKGADSGALAAAISRLGAETGARFFLVDAAADTLRDLADAVAGDEVLLLNVSEPENALRGGACRGNLLHTAPSRAMLTDALAQYLVSKTWRDVLVLKGPLAADAALAASFRRSARKFGARVVAERDFVLGNDPRQRGRNNVALMTSSPSHDVVFLADSDGEFGRYVPYQTSRPRPVVGTEGLVATAWHWTWERHGAPQLNQRFEKRAKRRMRGADWAAWAALKAVAEAAIRTKSTAFAVVAGYLRSAGLNLDAYKGTPASFRPWNNQLRQPILLRTHNAIVARAPIPGFLHAKDDLDTLGLDAPESGCKK